MLAKWKRLRETDRITSKPIQDLALLITQLHGGKKTEKSSQEAEDMGKRERETMTQSGDHRDLGSEVPGKLAPCSAATAPTPEKGLPGSEQGLLMEGYEECNTVHLSLILIQGFQSMIQSK